MKEYIIRLEDNTVRQHKLVAKTLRALAKEIGGEYYTKENYINPKRLTLSRVNALGKEQYSEGINVKR